MYKPLVLLCLVFCVIDARPSWQWLPPRDGYIPVYIRPGDTPLEEINPELAEAFHALPAGRSAGKQLEASQNFSEQTDEAAPDEITEQRDQPQPLAEMPERAEQPSEEMENAEDAIDHRPFEKTVLEKKNKKTYDVALPALS